MKLCATLVLVAIARAASAQPAPPAPPAGDKQDAKALMQSGVKLLEAHDYLGALAIFKDAYQRFPSAKILLNIGTTLKLLGRTADAANAYQRFLDAPDTDPSKRPEVEGVLAELDKTVGKVSITVTPPDAEVELDDEWLPAAQAHLVRVAPGTATFHARHAGYQPGTQSVTVAAGGQALLAITLQPVPRPEVKPVVVTVHDVAPRVEVQEGPRSRVGAFAMAHVSVHPRVGSAWLVGGTLDVTGQLAVDVALILGPGLVSSGMSYPAAPPSFGAYAGASYALLPGALRPRVALGFPVFASDGARFAVRAAGGVEYVTSRHLSVVLELGFEENLNPQNDIRDLAIVPALAAVGRL